MRKRQVSCTTDSVVLTTHLRWGMSYKQTVVDAEQPLAITLIFSSIDFQLSEEQTTAAHGDRIIIFYSLKRSLLDVPPRFATFSREL